MNDQETFECTRQDASTTNISQEAYDYLKDECLRAVEDGDVMIIAMLLRLHEYDGRAKIILAMNDLEVSMKHQEPDVLASRS